jgi:hypothetical protein
LGGSFKTFEFEVEKSYFFPGTLKSFKVSLDPSFSWPLMLYLFPPTIEEISFYTPLTRHSLKTGEWNALSKLNSLMSLTCYVNGVFGKKEASLLPRSLEELVMSQVESYIYESDWIEMANALPKTIKIMSGIHPFALSLPIIENLPRALQKINHIQYSPEWIHLLPDSYTDLQVSSGDHSLIASFPSNLKSLSLLGIAEGLLEKIPTQLQSLRLTKVNVKLSGEIVSKLPRSLTSLVANWAQDPIEAIEPLFLAFPPALTSFRAALPHSYRAHGDFTPQNYHPVPTPSQSSLLLPRCLKTLEIGCLDFSEGGLTDWILGLPRSLAILSLTLTRLQSGLFTSLGALDSLVNFSIATDRTPIGGWQQHLNFGSLPLSLLKITISSSGLSASDIPRHLFVGTPLALRSCRDQTSAIEIQFYPNPRLYAYE